jgi:hypothetical protein
MFFSSNAGFLYIEKKERNREGLNAPERKVAANAARRGRPAARCARKLKL